MKLKISETLGLPLDATTQALAFLGRRGSGKSYAATKLAELLYEREAQFVAIDPVGIWWGLRLSSDGKGDGLDIPIFGGLHGDIPVAATAGAMLADVIVDRSISAVLDVSQFESDADKARFARDFAARFFFRKKSSPSAVHLFIEEAQEFIPQNIQRGEEQMLHAFQRMIRLGRNFGIGVSMISQRPQDVNKKALNQAECIFCFQLTGPQERKAVEDWVSDKGLSDDLSQLLPDLKIGHAHVWSPVWLNVNEEVAVNEKQTFSAGSTPKVGERPIKTKPLAAIELEKLHKDIAATVEQAKANDPAQLKRQIADLQKQLAARPKEQPKATETRIEVPVLKNGQLDRAEKHAAKLDALAQKFLDGSNAIAERLLNESATLRKMIEPATNRPPQPARAITPRAAVIRPSVPRSNPSPRPARQPSEDSGELGKGERAILIATAQHAEGVTRDQLTVLCGYKRSSRDTYLQRLRERGLIDQAGDSIVATDAGVAALGSDYEPLPTGDELRSHWQNRLKGGEAVIFEQVTAAYPETVSREALSEATGYQRSSRDTYLQRLASRKLIVNVGRGEVRAADQLFDGSPGMIDRNRNPRWA